LLATHDPIATNVVDRLKAPSAEHWFGTDDLGRDAYSRVIFGSRYSLLAGVVIVLISLFIGSSVGLLAGYPGGRRGELIMRVADVFLAFPTILAAISLSATIGASFFNALLSISIFYWAKYARLVYGQVLSFKENEYVKYAEVLRKKRFYVWMKHLYPNILPVILVQVTVDFGDAILFFAALSFLGLGAQPPAPDWGAMISYGQRVMAIAPWLSIFPGIFIFLVVLGANLLGDALRDALDATMRQRELKFGITRFTWLGVLRKLFAGKGKEDESNERQSTASR
jgi:peptide/nickel transport system permease protein